MNEFQPRFVFRDLRDAEHFDAFVLAHLDELENAKTEIRIIRMMDQRFQISGSVHGKEVYGAYEAVQELNVQIRMYLDLHVSLQAEIERLRNEEVEATRRENR